MLASTSVCVGLLIGGAAIAQPGSSPPAFEIADVHASAKSLQPVLISLGLRDGRYELRTATMLDLIRTAYGVDAGKVLGGPNWLEWDRFDVIAKAPPDTPPETLAKMLQQLLADRFKLVVHGEPALGIVVDSVNRKPAANPPGVTASLPLPPPAQFEVAEIRMSKPEEPPAGTIRNGRVDFQNFPLKNLIRLAWDLPEEMLAEAPKWMDSANIDLVAKASTAVVPAGDRPADMGALRVMLRSLLVDRFKLATRFEDRPVNAYTLTAVKPKLQPADPSRRTKCKEGPGADGKDPRLANRVLSRLISCQNVTMAQFVEQFPRLANDYTRIPGLDATGLDGAYDFTLSFSPAGAIQGPEAADPNGALSFPDAISKQLGLKLEMQKRPIPVLVIDHIEQQPTGN